jgi:hypothetical protein
MIVPSFCCSPILPLVAIIYQLLVVFYSFSITQDEIRSIDIFPKKDTRYSIDRELMILYLVPYKKIPIKWKLFALKIPL